MVLAFEYSIEFDDAINVIGVVITLSFLPQFRALPTKCKPAVPLDKTVQYFA